MKSGILTSDSSKRIIKMVDLQHVASFRWTEAQAAKLTAIRGKMSRRQLEQKTIEIGKKVTHQYIEQLERPEYYVGRLKNGDALTVSIEVVQVLCQALEVDISEFFNTANITVDA
jgi:DNA-binding Xre family transcriptional regulator